MLHLRRRVLATLLLGALAAPGLVAQSTYQQRGNNLPPVPKDERIYSAGYIAREVLVGTLPLLGLITATLGSIIGGLATPTEAAGIGSVGALILAIAYRRFSLGGLQRALISTMATSPPPDSEKPIAPGGSRGDASAAASVDGIPAAARRMARSLASSASSGPG